MDLRQKLYISIKRYYTSWSLRAEIKVNDVNMEARISIARRMLYSMMNTGLHGTNGLYPQTSYKIYQSYVISRLLYGMEILSLNQKQMEILSLFHKKNLRNFQSIPARTAIGAVYLILGALTIEAGIHERQLSFLYFHLSSNIPTSPAYGIYISQLIRYS